MIPELVDNGSLWRVLPAGVHDATLEEIRERFAINDKRQKLFQGFVRGWTALRVAGCRVVYLDGSFVTEKDLPNDYDVCWDPSNVDTRTLNPVFLDFSQARRNQKLMFGGEYFPSSVTAVGNIPFIQFFRICKDTGKEKGIIRISP